MIFNYFCYICWMKYKNMINNVSVAFVKLLALGVVLSMQGCSDRLCGDSSLKPDGDRGSDVAGMRSYFESEGLAVFPLGFSADGVLSRSVTPEQSLEVLWGKAVQVNTVPQVIEIPLAKPVCVSQQGRTGKSFLVVQKEREGDYFCFVRTAIPLTAGVVGAGWDELVLLSTLSGVYSNAYLLTAGGEHRSVGMKLQDGTVISSRAGGEPDTAGTVANPLPVPVDPEPPVPTDTTVIAVPPTTHPINPIDPTTPTEPSTMLPTTPTVVGDSIIVTITTPTGVADFLICSLCHSYPCLCPDLPETEETPQETHRCPYCGSTTCLMKLYLCSNCRKFHCDTRCTQSCILCKQSYCSCCKNCVSKVCECKGKLCKHNLCDPCEASLNAEYCPTCEGRCKCLEKGHCFHTLPCKYFNPRYCEVCRGTCGCLVGGHCAHTPKCEGFVLK